MQVSGVSSFKNQYQAFNAFPSHSKWQESFGSTTIKKEGNNDVFILGGGTALAAGSGLALLLRGRFKTTPYLRSLANHLSQELGIKISPKALRSVMSKEELLKILPKLSKENYIASPENIEKGIFCIDLHSHTKFSDGLQSVSERLDDIAAYADKLYSKSKRKFIYSITDHDTVDGVKEALKVIAKNPKKFKNVKFVPGVELSFTHAAPLSGNECEISEVLAFGLNPYAKNVTAFLSNLGKKRGSMVSNFISDAASKYKNVTFTSYELNKYYDMDVFGPMMNSHWRVNHYLQTKKAVANYAESLKQNPEVLYARIMENNRGASLAELVDRKILPQHYIEDTEIMGFRKKYEPHFLDGKIITSSENTFEDVISAFQSDANVFLAYAHPGYFLDKTNKVEYLMSYLHQKSKGLLMATESYHQAYNSSIKSQDVDRITNYTRSLKLLDLGGLDDHEAKYLKGEP